MLRENTRHSIKILIWYTPWLSFLKISINPFYHVDIHRWRWKAELLCHYLRLTFMSDRVESFRCFLYSAPGFLNPWLLWEANKHFYCKNLRNQLRIVLRTYYVGMHVIKKLKLNLIFLRANQGLIQAPADGFYFPFKHPWTFSFHDFFMRTMTFT
jgi:hypothetical protein